MRLGFCTQTVMEWHSKLDQLFNWLHPNWGNNYIFDLSQHEQLLLFQEKNETVHFLGGVIS